MEQYVVSTLEKLLQAAVSAVLCSISKLSRGAADPIPFNIFSPSVRSKKGNEAKRRVGCGRCRATATYSQYRT
jgi:hypothetical protein